jgi:hypothetical protein
MSDKITDALVAALRGAASGPPEQPLFKAGKASGLFPGRTGVSGTAATRALQDDLLVIVRTDTKGKSALDWARITPAGIQFLHEHESPLKVLAEIRDALTASRAGVPIWLSELRAELNELSQRLNNTAGAWSHRLDLLALRVEDALVRIDTQKAEGESGNGESFPWAKEAIVYLDRRRDAGAQSPCPLPELFEAIDGRKRDLSVVKFHDGLRHLRDRQIVRLFAHDGPASTLGQPEYALLDGAELVYYAAR